MGTAERNRPRENGDEDAVPDLVCGLEYGRRYEDTCPEDQEAHSEDGFDGDAEEQIASGSVRLSGAKKRRVQARELCNKNPFSCELRVFEL